MDAVETFSRQMFVVNDVLIAQSVIQQLAVAAGHENHQVGM